MLPDWFCEIFEVQRRCFFLLGNQCFIKGGTQYHGLYIAFNHYMMCDNKYFIVRDVTRVLSNISDFLLLKKEKTVSTYY